MPPRSFVVLVILAWLGTTTWLLYREAWPYLQTGGPPPYAIDLTEELSTSEVNWKIYQNQKDIGYGISRVERKPDRTYQLRTTLRFTRFPILNLNKLETGYHITEEGALLGLSAQCLLHIGPGDPTVPNVDLRLEGTIVDGQLEPRMFLDKQPLPIGAIKIPIAERGSILNPMQLLNRVPGLREGRTWQMTLFDPMKSLGHAFPEYKEVLAAAEGVRVPELHALVVSDTLQWANVPVRCYKIEYRKPGELDPVAATWVRQSDGLVLQQQSRTALMEMTLTRHTDITPAPLSP
jgi:hypothetical protein